MQIHQRPAYVLKNIVDNTLGKCEHNWTTHFFDGRLKMYQVCNKCRRDCSVEFNAETYKYVRNYIR